MFFSLFSKKYICNNNKTIPGNIAYKTEKKTKRAQTYQDFK